MNSPVGETKKTTLKGLQIEEGHKYSRISWESHHPANLVSIDGRLHLMVFTTSGEAQRYFITHPTHKSIARLG
jgi:hypothetical protein